MILMQGFGARLEHAMKLAGAKPADVYKHCGIDVSTVNKWLHESREVSAVQAKNLYCVADYLKVSARWLATGKGDARPARDGLPFTAVKIAQAVESLTPEQQLVVEALLSQLRRN